VNARQSIAKLLRQKTLLSRSGIVFTLSSSGYCAIHWLSTHNFSIYVLSGALAVGTAAVAIAWLLDWLWSSRSSST
jgi:hypothetical protein